MLAIIILSLLGLGFVAWGSGEIDDLFDSIDEVSDDVEDFIAEVEGEDLLGLIDAEDDPTLASVVASLDQGGEADQDPAAGDPVAMTLRGDDGDDLLIGGPGADSLFGGAGDDALLGNGGDDLIEVGAGADTAFGGAGDDRIAAGGETGIHGLATDEGDGQPDVLDGGDGDDTITGDAEDKVTGGPGADLIASFGIDRTSGGGVTVTDFDPQEDTLLLRSTDGSPLAWTPDDPRYAVEQASNGRDTNIVFDSRLLAVLQDTDAADLRADLSWFANIEAASDTPDAVDTFSVQDTEASPVTQFNRIDGSARSDLLEGTPGPDSIAGGAGDDTLDGGPGADVLRTGDGADVAFGGAGNDDQRGFDELQQTGIALGAEDSASDTLDGGAGDDTITGNDGDEMTGGAGADLFRALGIGQPPGQTPVLITDFDPREDSLMLVDSAGEDARFADTDGGAIDPDSVVEVRATADGTGAEVLYDGAVLVTLQGTSVDELLGENVWLANAGALVLSQITASPASAA